MPKSADDYRSEQDKAILSSPDHFLIRAFSQNFWYDSVPFDAPTALIRYNNIRELKGSYRLAVLAVKKIHGQECVCPITEKMLEEYAAG